MADVLSHMDTEGVTTEHEEEDILCFTTYHNNEGVLNSEAGGSEVWHDEDDEVAVHDIMEDEHVAWDGYLTQSAKDEGVFQMKRCRAK